MTRFKHWILILSVPGLGRQGLGLSGLLALATSNYRAIVVPSHVVLCNSLISCMCSVWLETLFWALGCRGHKAGKAQL